VWLTSLKIANLLEGLYICKRIKILTKGGKDLSSKVGLIYMLENIDAEEGVDVFEIAPTIMYFGELIRSANSVLGYEQKIDVRIKPFAEGSWITEFILQSTYIDNIINYISSEEGKDLFLLLGLLGISNIRAGITGVAQIIRFTKGFVSNFKKTGGKITYINDKGEELTVSLEEHKLVQSPLIQNNYYNCMISPFDKFPTVSAVSLSNIEGELEQRFTPSDKPAFKAYVNAELFEDTEDVETVLSNVFLKPKRGSFSGMEQAYSFIMGDSTLWPVTIEDEGFLSKIRSGETRLYSEDVLKVNLKILQKKDAVNKIANKYVITEVLEYTKYEERKQLRINDFTDDE
jgi:hypothetical protein